MSLVVALAGDALLTRSMMLKRQQNGELQRLLKSCDIRFCNVETLFHNFEYPAASESGGTWVHAAPELAYELAELGINLASLANNHAGDYGAETLLSSRERLENTGISCAGAGRDLGAARAAEYLDTPSGRVALVAATSTAPTHIFSGYSHDGIPGRPGVSPLRFTKEYIVPRTELKVLQSIRDGLFYDPLDPRVTDDGDSRAVLAGMTFREGDGFSWSSRPDTNDVREICEHISEATDQADLVIASLHAHASNGSWDEPPEYINQAAEALIDAGAHIVAVHGPHQIRGVRMYRDRPIFFSLGNFIFQNDTVPRQPLQVPGKSGTSKMSREDIRSIRKQWIEQFHSRADCWSSILPIMIWEKGLLVGMTIHSLDLGREKSFADRGIPRIDRENGFLGLKRLERLSQKLGTNFILDSDQCTATLSRRLEHP